MDLISFWFSQRSLRGLPILIHTHIYIYIRGGSHTALFFAECESKPFIAVAQSLQDDALDKRQCFLQLTVELHLTQPEHLKHLETAIPFQTMYKLQTFVLAY